MRAPSALLPLLAAALVVTGCSGPGPLHAEPVHAQAATAHQQVVGCDQAIQQTGAVAGKVLFGVVAVPPEHLARAVPTGSRPWSYFRKYGIAIRAGSPAVLITVPDSWRHRAAIAWGNNGVSSLRLLSCPRQVGPWNAYAGGFYLRSPSDCVPLVFEVGRRIATVRFAIGRSCGSAAHTGQ